MLHRSFIPTFYDLYQMFIAILGMVGVNRVLFGFSWLISVEYAVAAVAAYWIGQSLVGALQNSRKASLGSD